MLADISVRVPWGAASRGSFHPGKPLLASRSQASRPPFRVTLFISPSNAGQDSGGLQLETAALHSGTGKRLFRHFSIAAFHRACGILLYYHSSVQLSPRSGMVIFMQRIGIL